MSPENAASFPNRRTETEKAVTTAPMRSTTCADRFRNRRGCCRERLGALDGTVVRCGPSGDPGSDPGGDRVRTSRSLTLCSRPRPSHDRRRREVDGQREYEEGE